MRERKISTLRVSVVCSGILATVYNGSLIYILSTWLQTIRSNDELILVLQVLLEVLMLLAAVHIFISLLLIYGVLKGKADLVMLWVVVYSSSCVVVSSMFSVGVSCLLSKKFLYIILCNFISIFSIVITYRLYKKMIVAAQTVKIALQHK